MKLILGLGNPGSQYEKTRHNVGWRVLDRLAASHDFPAFALDKKMRAEVSTGTIGGEKVLLAKPQTFMNLSGESARALLDFYKCTPADVVAVYDDKDIAYGTLRIRAEGGAGGHNGVKSLIAHLGTPAFARVRVGVANDFTARTPTDQFVLARFSAEEEAALPALLARAADATVATLREGVEAAGNRFNAAVN